MRKKGRIISTVDENTKIIMDNRSKKSGVENDKDERKIRKLI